MRRFFAATFVIAGLVFATSAKAFVPWLLSALLHANVLVGALFDFVSQTDPDTGTIIEVQLSPDYEPPEPPLPSERLPALEHPLYVARQDNNYGALASVYGKTQQHLIESLNEALARPSFSGQPWYGKVRAAALVDLSGTQLPASAPGGYIQYEILTDFVLDPPNGCSVFLAGARVYSGTGVLDAPHPLNAGTCRPYDNNSPTINNGSNSGSSRARSLLWVKGSASQSHYILPRRLEVLPPSCDRGYSYDYEARDCTLSDPTKTDQGPDGTCPVTWLGAFGYAVNSKDPDCQRAEKSKALTLPGSSSGASPSVIVTTADPTTPGQVLQHTLARDSSGSTASSVFVKAPTGVVQETQRVISPEGVVDRETPKAPYYQTPGSSGSTGVTAIIPGITYPAPGTGAVQCGGLGMPACSTTLTDGSGNAIDFEGLKPQAGDPVGEVPEDVPDLDLGGLASSAVLPASPVCPSDAFSFTMPFPSFVGGPMVVTDQGVFCEVLGDYTEPIRRISIAVGWLAGLFIVLKA